MPDLQSRIAPRMAAFVKELAALGREVARGERAARRGALGARAVSYLLSHPASSATDIHVALGITQRELRGLLPKLIRSKLVRGTGSTRGRRYSAAAQATSRAKRPAR